ncbi:sterol carrier family protein [Corynebacterium pacaense]|uniref:sterol carrier family protein n=1 Tax=Corynebacterium pacaense TaxID=1816684 RepID=UPI0009B98796|nr:sterol carrier family protein [Corynebacterium pacaense]
MRIDPQDTRDAVIAVAAWIAGPEEGEKPDRRAIANAVRLTARTLAQESPGHSVEVRVPPFVAVQCIEGPRHTRGTPPNVVETDARTWLRLATGLSSFEEEESAGRLSASGTRAGEISARLPILPL